MSEIKIISVDALPPGYRWRTWFLDVCEASGLFGLTDLQLPAAQDPSFTVGSQVFLVDAPYRLSSKTVDRVCGPYEVISPARLPSGAEVVHSVKGHPIIYRDPSPERGPWLDRNGVTREIEGLRVTFNQFASNKKLAYFPFRFAIRKTSGASQLAHHEPPCSLCK